MKFIRNLVILVIFLVALLPFILGFEIENRYRGLLSELEAQGYRLDSHEYARGFYDARAESTFSMPVNMPDGENFDLSFTISSNIKHGPYSLDGWAGNLAVIKTAFFYEDQALLGDESGEQVQTELHFNSDGHTRINMPALTQARQLNDDLMLDFKGLSGDIQFNTVNGTIVMTLTGEGLSVYSPGKGRLDINRYQLNSDSARGINDLMLGSGDFSIDRVTFNDNETAFGMELNNFQVEAITSARDEVLDLKVTYSLDRLKVADQEYASALLEVSFDSISAAAVARIQESLKEMQQNQVPPEQQGMAIMGTFMSVLPAMLEHNPEFAIDKLQVSTPQGDVKLNFTLRAQDMKVTDVSMPQSMLQKLVADARLEVPETLVRDALKQVALQQQLAGLQNQADQEEPIDFEKINENADRQVNSQIEIAINQGFIEKKEGSLVSVASMKAGLLSVNGKTIPLPPVQ